MKTRHGLHSTVRMGALLSLLCAAWGAQATIISYSVENIHDNTWEYQYAVTNDTLDVSIEQFTILFALDSDSNPLHSNLTVAKVPDAWDPMVAQPDAAVPDEGFFDVQTKGPGIDPGDTVGGFAVRFEFLGAGTPGAQEFLILDPNNFFDILDQGTTELAATTPPVPVRAPGTVLLSILGFTALVFARQSFATSTAT